MEKVVVFLRENQLTDIVDRFREGDSKLHSVERYHVCENRALSQRGVIDSHQINASEKDEKWLFDLEKFHENMEHAANEAVQRISQTPFANDKFEAYRAVSADDWVFSKTLEKLIREFLRVDNSNYRMSKHFMIKPGGKIWNELCSIYKLKPDLTFSACSIFNEANNTDNVWIEHYGFTTYRPDDAWRGSSLKRFEIQPIIDITKLPEHHYLPFYKAKNLVESFLLENELPTCLTVPDFFMPTKHLDFILEDKPDIFKDQNKLKLLSDIIGVSVEQILNYVHTQEEKDIHKCGRKDILELHKSDLGLLPKSELKIALKTFNLAYTREQDYKADVILVLAKHLKETQKDLKEFVDEFRY